MFLGAVQDASSQCSDLEWSRRATNRGSCYGRKSEGPGTQASSRSGSVGPASGGPPQASPGAATNMPGEQTDQVDVSLAFARRAHCLRRELNRLRASK